ncbi:uncharacterized protein A1O9_00445 [Exophiala aquamarina CBS 119918]|uniref:Uncharacterized protein n=1 Tax=Exophiala aquamarina CBS 119918 TaxID=1182545 RepID=A0A072PRT1_9EURO|nr:uncharacterized protein A1O9_00445 [Exophiala aquamarina CBS 119918]KEF62472.1 hypothetical protein A1O9_00445 [Exophiala aquamarina CBS 119918]
MELHNLRAIRIICDLRLILHCQSREAGVTKFWDAGSQTIQLLSRKCLGPDVVFAYDWHWRGKGRDLATPFPDCGRPLRKEALSRRQKAFGPRSQRQVQRRRFEKEFEDHIVRRMTAFVDHPVAAMFNPDAALNFVMCLLAIPLDEISFTETGAKSRKGMPGSAPLKEVHEYVTMEAGQSVASALRTKINDSISKSLQQSGKFAAAYRRRNADRYGFEFKELWDAKEVMLTARGYISLHLSEERGALENLVPFKARKKGLAAQAKNEKTVIFFTKTGVELKPGGDLTVTLSIDELRKQQGFRQEGVDQHHKELARKGELKRNGNGEFELICMMNR